MARNTQHLAPSKRVKTYSGRNGTTESKFGGTYTNSFKNSTKVRSGAASQKEYLDTSNSSSVTGNMAVSTSKYDKVMKGIKKKAKGRGGM